LKSNTISLLHGKEVAGLNITKGIKNFGGNEEAYIQVLRTYATNSRKVLAKLSAVDKDSMDDYEIVIHGIKGSSASICADSLASLAKKLEVAAKAGDWTFISGQNKQFIDEAGELIENLDIMLASIDSESPKPAKDKPDSALFRKLITSCETYDMGGVDAAMDEISSYCYENETDNDLVKWLHENVEQMNFSEIVERLSDM